MATHKEIEKYVNALKGPSRFSHTLLWMSLAFLVCFFTWAYFAKLDEVTHSDGKVIPSQKTQLIQNLEGGIVKKIMVQEGQIVENGEVLIQLDPVQFHSELKETQSRLVALQIKYERLLAMAHNTPFEPHPSLVAKAPQLAASEKLLFESDHHVMESMLQNKHLIQQEIAMTEPLIKSGSVSEVEVIRLKQQLSDISTKIGNDKSEVLDQLNKTKADLDSLYETLAKYEDKLNRTTIRSPMRGIVKQLHVNTIGGVIRSGDALLEIVPVDDTLLVEVKVKPKDIGFIHQGLPAKVKISAYDFAIYGGLDGKVEHISADTIVDDKSKNGDTFYEVWIRTDKNFLMKNDKKLPIIPGMVAKVDILTGDKTVFDYLMKPILKARQNAMRER